MQEWEWGLVSDAGLLSHPLATSSCQFLRIEGGFPGLGCGLTSPDFPVCWEESFPCTCFQMLWGEGSGPLVLKGTSSYSTQQAPLTVPPCSQDCLRACQEQIEAALRESLREAAQTSPSPGPKAPRGSSSQGPSQTSTPTDVTAIHL